MNYKEVIKTLESEIEQRRAIITALLGLTEAPSYPQVELGRLSIRNGILKIMNGSPMSTNEIYQAVRGIGVVCKRVSINPQLSVMTKKGEVVRTGIIGEYKKA